MVYYFVYIRYLDKLKEKQDLLYYNLREEDLKKEIAGPFNKGKQFAPLGIILKPSDVLRIVIFRSKKNFKNIVLPNKAKAIDANITNIVWDFYNEKVEDVNACTNEFIFTTVEQKGLGDISEIEKTKKKMVFIGHGQNIKEALELQKYLKDDLGVNAKIFEDLKKESGCKTIIELLEFFKENVRYAFIIFTSDDYGCRVSELNQLTTELTWDKKKPKIEAIKKICELLQKRARQNVVFELGLFLGALGRDDVCYLLQKTVNDTPSNMDGVLHESFEKAICETFTSVTEKLKKIKLI